MAKQLEIVDGVECSVETGTGVLITLDESRRNWRVEFRADHVRLQKPVAGWVDPGANTDSPLVPIVREAHAKALRVAYRVVIRRKPNQPTDVPLSEIPNDQRVRDVVDVVPIAANAGVPSGWTNGAASSGPAAAAQQAPAGPESPPAGDEPPPTPDGDPGPSEPGQAPPRSRDGKRGPRIEEAKPWEPYNSDGSLNLGSYAVGAVEGIVLLAHDLLLERARFLAKAEGQAPAGPPSRGQLLGLARRLLIAADRIQMASREDGHFDRMDSSHTRARAATRAALEVHPVPWGADPDDLDTWIEQLVVHGALLMAVVLDLVDPDRRRPAEAAA